MFDRAEARVDLDRIKANIKHLKDVSGTPVMAVVRGNDVDQPRNLAKSVTVE